MNKHEHWLTLALFLILLNVIWPVVMARNTNAQHPFVCSRTVNVTVAVCMCFGCVYARTQIDGKSNLFRHFLFTSITKTRAPERERSRKLPSSHTIKAIRCLYTMNICFESLVVFIIWSVHSKPERETVKKDIYKPLVLCRFSKSKRQTLE